MGGRKFDNQSFIGKRIGHLTVLSHIGNRVISGKSRNFWLCRCRCGNTKEIMHQSLISGKAKSCGCKRHCPDPSLVKRNTLSQIKTMISEIEPDANGCKLWKWTQDGHGYGQISYKNKVHRAHRLSYIAFKGSIPKGSVIRHMCHTPLCVNPEHLRYGSMADNSRDAKESGRIRKGNQHYRHKLTEAQAKHILLHELPTNCNLAAERYGVSRQAISALINGRNWSWISRDDH